MLPILYTIMITGGMTVYFITTSTTTIKWSTCEEVLLLTRQQVADLGRAVRARFLRGRTMPINLGPRDYNLDLLVTEETPNMVALYAHLLADVTEGAWKMVENRERRKGKARRLPRAVVGCTGSVGVGSHYYSVVLS